MQKVYTSVSGTVDKWTCLRASGCVINYKSIGQVQRSQVQITQPRDFRQIDCAQIDGLGDCKLQPAGSNAENAEARSKGAAPLE